MRDLLNAMIVRPPFRTTGGLAAWTGSSCLGRRSASVSAEGDLVKRLAALALAAGLACAFTADVARAADPTPQALLTDALLCKVDPKLTPATPANADLCALRPSPEGIPPVLTKQVPGECSAPSPACQRGGGQGRGRIIPGISSTHACTWSGSGPPLNGQSSAEDPTREETA